MTFMRRRESSSSQGPACGLFVATAADVDRWGALLEHVGAVEWQDGTRRVPGTVVMFVEDGKLKLCLSDKDQGLVGFVAGDTLLGVLETAERLLREDRVDWRASKARAPQRRS